MSICDDCILQDRCDGNCGDTNPNYYAEQEENDRYDSEQLHSCDWCENDFLEDELTDTNYATDVYRQYEAEANE